MGGRKADLVVGGLTLAAHVHRRISPFCGEVVCVGGSAYLSGIGVETIPDRFPGADSMGGIATALHYALEKYGENAWVLCVACDMPLISPEVLSLIIGRREGRDIVATHTGPGYEPLCSLYRAGVYPVLERRIAEGNLRLRDIFGLVNTLTVGEAELRRLDPELVSFSNVNRPEDVATVLKNLPTQPSKPLDRG